MFKSKYFYLAIFTVLLLSIISTFNIYNSNKISESNTGNNNSNNKEYISLKIKDKIFNLKISDNDQERRQGLSNAKMLKENEGMIFVFPDSQIRNFWMKDMNYNIDIIYLNQNKEIISMYIDADKDSYNAQNPEKSKLYNSILPAKYVMEINSNEINRLNLNLKEVITF